LERMGRFTSLARNLAQSEEGLSLMVMLLDDYYQQSLHAPPEQPAIDAGKEGGSKPNGKKRRPRSRNRKPRKDT